MENVEVVERGKITVNIYEGQKGDPGKSLRFEDLTPEQIEQLKGPKGDKGDPGSGADVKEAYDLLVSRGYLPNSSSVNDVLKLIIDKTNIVDLFQFARLEVRVPVKYGDTTIQIGGIGADGLIIKEQGTENTSTLHGITQFSYPFTLSHPMDERSVTLEAIWQGEVKSTLVIPGIPKNTDIHISDDQLEILTPSNTNREMTYTKKDNELWLQDNTYPTELNPFVIAGLYPELGQVQFDTIVLRLYADSNVRLKDSSNTLGIRYKTNDGNVPDVSIYSDKTVILDMQQWGLKCDNFIVVREQGHGVNGKDTLTFIAPKNMLVGTAYTGTTNVPCITANQGDVVQINIKDLTVKILGTEGEKEAL